MHGAVINDKLLKIGSLRGMPSNGVRRTLESNDVEKVIELVTFYRIKRSKVYLSAKSIFKSQESIKVLMHKSILL